MTPRFKQTIHIEKTAPHPESHTFPPILTIFELVHDINKTNILTKFHDREKIHVRKTAPLPWRPCFSTDQNHFQTQEATYPLHKHFGKVNVTSRFHEDRRRNAVSSVPKAKVHDGHRSIKYKHEH
ncbi:hypothetical protein DPMN_099953 [Dreissena polymorpha]|uniref:Uncharacterized protein n=1 Tax=Dreissena polymorpha TaxID=45954 RepID=A0A9D4LFX2_DREPO|nr:hypothetical protein DPMN_099953 [Dreissena polymorpha]